MGKAERLLGPAGPPTSGRMPTADEVRAAVRRDVRRYRKVQKQRGLPTDGGRIGGPDDTYCNPRPGSWIKSF